MFEGTGKALSSFVEERLSSPLLGTFLVSWCVWNYRFLVILFSDATISRTFALIDGTAFPDITTLALRGFLLPLTTTLLYIYVYPFPSQRVFEHWKRTQKALTVIRQKYDDEILLSVEESRTLRAENTSLKDEMEATRQALQAAGADVTGYQRQVSDLGREAAELRERLEVVTTALSRSQSVAEGVAQDILKAETAARDAHAARNAADGRIARLEAELASAKEAQQSQKRATPLPTVDELKLISIIANDFSGSLTWRELNERPSGEHVHWLYLLHEMLEKGLVEKMFDQDGDERGFALTQDGRRALYARE